MTWNRNKAADGSTFYTLSGREAWVRREGEVWIWAAQWGRNEGMIEAARGWSELCFKAKEECQRWIVQKQLESTGIFEVAE